MTSELHCKYVGSRALLNICTRKSPTPVPDFDGLSPKLYENLQSNEILHVCPQALNNFVKKVLPNITTCFILVTNNSDWTIPEDVSKEFDILINHSLLTHWFAQNCVLDHPKITHIPIGLDYHTLIPRYHKSFAWTEPKPIPESHPWGIKQEPILQEQRLVRFQSEARPFWERQIKAYANFQFLMDTRYGKVDRIDALNTVPKDLVYYEPTRAIRIECWSNMINHAFVLSPQGNGIDCHRTWEALCLGCIPIIKTSGLDPLFKDLPVWIVSAWSEVTKENMVAKINEFKEKEFRIEKLTLEYWRKTIWGKRE